LHCGALVGRHTCFLQATHAVIFLVMSGGFPSPNCSRKAATGVDGEPFMVEVVSASPP